MSSENRTRFSANNIGVALNLYQGIGPLTSVTIGFAYNKLADFNNTQYFYGHTPLNSITELFAEQIYGVSQSTLNTGGYKPYDDVDVNQWGGVLAWQTGILDATSSSGTTYTPFNNLDPDAKVYNTMKTVSSGYVSEYALSMGANLDSRLYLGITVGFQDVSYASENYYTENYSDYDSYYTLESMAYNRYTKMTGAGINFKVGAIYRPVDLLRIGIAYHSPTWLSLENTYIDEMAATYYGSSAGSFIDTPYLFNNINIQTPSRLLTGASLTIPGFGIFSADYERVWYSGVKMGYSNGNNQGSEYFDGIYVGSSYDNGITEQAKELYKASDNLRLGLELNPVENVFVRAGYANYDSAFEYDDMISSNGIPDKTSWVNYSAGLGFRFGNTYFDITYIHSIVDYTLADIFYTSFYDSSYGNVTIESGSFSTQLKRNSVTLTLGSRF